MATSIPYHLPSPSKTVFHAGITVRKQEGKYSLDPIVHLGGSNDLEPTVADQVARAVGEVIRSLNAA
jgi:hypothetical protein